MISMKETSCRSKFSLGHMTSVFQTFPQAPTDSTLHHAGQLGHGVGSLLGYLGDKQEHPQPPKHAGKRLQVSLFEVTCPVFRLMMSH